MQNTYLHSKQVRKLRFSLKRKRYGNFIKKQLEQYERVKKIISFDRERARAEARKAMGIAQGHWFACKNGHPYYIGDCGGPMQVSKCPDCGAKVGGEQHRLEADNRIAMEMDGATTPAYPVFARHN